MELTSFLYASMSNYLKEYSYLWFESGMDKYLVKLLDYIRNVQCRTLADIKDVVSYCADGTQWFAYNEYLKFQPLSEHFVYYLTEHSNEYLNMYITGQKFMGLDPMLIEI